MSIAIVQEGGPGKAPTYREFLISSASDVANLPTTVRNASGEVAGAGSVAYTNDMAHTYMLGNDDTWREV